MQETAKNEADEVVVGGGSALDNSFQSSQLERASCPGDEEDEEEDNDESSIEESIVHIEVPLPSQVAQPSHHLKESVVS